MSENAEHGYNIIGPDCGEWIPVAGFGGAHTALISMPCSAPHGHEGAHRITIETPEWRVTIQGERREGSG